MIIRFPSLRAGSFERINAYFGVLRLPQVVLATLDW